MNIYLNKFADLAPLPGEPRNPIDPDPIPKYDCCILGVQKSDFYQLLLMVAVVVLLVGISILIIKKIKKI